MIFKYLGSNEYSELLPVRCKTIQGRTMVYAHGVTQIGDNNITQKHCIFPDNAGWYCYEGTSRQGKWTKTTGAKCICVYGYNLPLPEDDRKVSWASMRNQPVDSYYDNTYVDWTYIHNTGGSHTIGMENMFFWKEKISGIEFFSVMCNMPKVAQEKIKLANYNEYDSYLHVKNAGMEDMWNALSVKGSDVISWPWETSVHGTRTMWHEKPQVFHFDRSSVTRQVKISPPTGWITFRWPKNLTPPAIHIHIGGCDDSRQKGIRVKDFYRGSDNSQFGFRPMASTYSGGEGGEDLTTNHFLAIIPNSHVANHKVITDTMGYSFYAVPWSKMDFSAYPEYYTCSQMYVFPPTLFFPASMVTPTTANDLYFEVQQWGYQFNSDNIA